MKNKADMISKLFTEQKNQPAIYQPGVFWEKALEDILNPYLTMGMQKFRSNRVNLKYFVPTYGSPANGFENGAVNEIIGSFDGKLNFKQELFIKRQFDGSAHALSDYRAFIISNKSRDPLGLSNFSESKIGQPIEHFKFNERWFSRSSLNYLLGLSFLLSITPKFKPKRILEIGGGFGTLAEILGKSNLTDYQYIGLDLPPLFLIARDYVTRCLCLEKKGAITKNIPNGKIKFVDLKQFSFLPNWKIEDVGGNIDFFVNFISFQEMEPNIVKNYVFHIQRLKPEWILLRNMREGKQIAKHNKIGVKKPVKKKDYISYFDRYELVDTSVLEYGYQTIDGFNSEILVLKRK